jgi:hypothetical protein
MENEKNSGDQLGKIQGTLEEILQQLKQQNRAGYQHDFSYTKLMGAVTQLLVIGLLFWTIVGLVDIGEISGSAGTMLKILGAVLLQLMALTFFFLEHQNR